MDRPPGPQASIHLVPVLARMLLAGERRETIPPPSAPLALRPSSPLAPRERGRGEGVATAADVATATEGGGPSTISRLIQRANERRERGLERFRDGYGRLLEAVLQHRLLTLAVALVVFGC